MRDENNKLLVIIKHGIFHDNNFYLLKHFQTVHSYLGDDKRKSKL